MTAYQVWIVTALVFFCLGPLGISLWLASSVLAILPKKRMRLLAGAAAFICLLSSGWIPGLNLYDTIGEDPSAPVTAGEILILGYLHAGAAVGLGIILFGRQRAPRSRIPPTREEDLGIGPPLLSIHAARRPLSPFPRIPFNRVYQVRQRDWEIPVDLGGRSLAPDLDGFTILHLSDLHLGNYLVPEYFKAVRERVQHLKRDVLIFTGDFLHPRGKIEDLQTWLQELASPSPTVAVLGNHDLLDHDRGQLESALTESGVRLLGGEVAVIRRGSGAVGLAGLHYQNWWKPFPVAALRRQIPEEALPVLVAHTPCVFPPAEKEGFLLVVCGHTHGGQIRFPGLGALFIPGRYGRRYQMGLYHVQKSYLHVHPGIGGPPPLRVACAPEITRLIIRSGI